MVETFGVHVLILIVFFFPLSLYVSEAGKTRAKTNKTAKKEFKQIITLLVQGCNITTCTHLALWVSRKEKERFSMENDSHLDLLRLLYFGPGISVCLFTLPVHTVWAPALTAGGSTAICMP